MANENSDNIIAELAPYEVTPPEEYATHKPKRRYPRACYKKAFEYALDKHDLRDKIKLVHGSYMPNILNRMGCHAEHAWIEIENRMVFDGTLQRFYDKDGYYSVCSNIKKNEYTFDEMVRNLREYGHYGEWV